MIPVEQLSGPDLDYWVAQAMGKTQPIREWNHTSIVEGLGSRRPFSPSQNPMHCHPIIEKLKVALIYNEITHHWRAAVYQYSEAAKSFVPQFKQFGDTYLIAACRTLVMSKYGPEVPEIEVSKPNDR